MRDDDDLDLGFPSRDAARLSDSKLGRVLEEKVRLLARQQDRPSQAGLLLWQAVTAVFARETRAHARRRGPDAPEPPVRLQMLEILRDVISELGRMPRTSGARRVIEAALEVEDEATLESVITELVRNRIVHGPDTGRTPSQDTQQSSDTTAERVAFRLAQLREDQGITLNDLSERLTGVGFPMSTSTLSKVENGQRRVTVEALLALAMALDVSPNWLLFPPTADNQTHIVVGNVVWTSGRAWQWALTDKPKEVSTGTGGGYDFYIASCGETGNWSLWMALQLQAWGCRVFHPRMIQPGEPWEPVLERAAADSDHILVLIGPDSPRAPAWNVADHAVMSGKRIIPIITTQEETPEPAKDLAVNLVGLDLTDTDRETAVNRLKSLLRLVRRPLLDADMPPFPGDPNK